MYNIGFYVQSRFGGWWLISGGGGGPTPHDNDYQFQDETEFTFQDGAQYEFQFPATP